MKMPWYVKTFGLVLGIFMIRLLVVGVPLFIVEYFHISYWFMIPLVILFISLFELILRIPLIHVRSRIEKMEN